MTHPTSSTSNSGLFPRNTASGIAQQTGLQGSASKDASAGTDPTQTFLDYMKKSLAEHMRDAWLAAHHLSQKDLDQMAPDKRAALEKQIAEEIKAEMKEQAGKKAKVSGLRALLLGAQ